MKNPQPLKCITWQQKWNSFNLGVRLKNEVYSLKHVKKAEKKKTSEAGWWFQPIWKILVKLCQIGSCPQIGMKIKHIWNHHLYILDDDWDSNAEFISSMVES